MKPKDAVQLLSAASATVFLLCLPVRLRQLRTLRTQSATSWIGILKAAVSVLLSILLLAFLVKLNDRSSRTDTFDVVSLSASLVAAFGLSLLLCLEGRSARPSDLAVLYLLASVGCDVALLTLPTREGVRAEVLSYVVVRLLLHSALLVLETAGNHSMEGYAGSRKSPEELNGVLSRAFFTWINPMLLKGYRKILTQEDLPPLRSDVRPGRTRNAMLRAWDQRAKPETKRTLPLVLLKCIRKPFMAAIIPRLFLIVFRYSQPMLIRQSIRFVTMPSESAVTMRGYWLIVSAVVVYLGLAISTAVYQHTLNRLSLVTKSALVGLIHDKTIRSPSIAYDDGEATTLMGTDVEGLEGVGGMFHETWAQCLEVIIGIFLLAQEVGWIWPLPLALIYLCSHMSRYVARHLQSRQKAWNTATQSRMATTSNMLAHMKVVKMLGFQHRLAEGIQVLRIAELSAASKVRWMMVWYNASANALGIFSPAITLVLYAVLAAATGRNFDTETAFTTVAILGMITHPANMVMTIVPRGVAAFAGFTRIQDFLLRPSLDDRRAELHATSTLGASSGPASSQACPAISIHNLTIGDKVPILEDVNITVAPGSLAIISGPVGSGKTSLLRAILGETAPIQGSVALSTKRIAYCAQRPWLSNGSIKEVICGYTDHYDEQWYRQIVDACCLAHDFGSLPDGDNTQVGSRGLNLSGGQRQRVALARAVYTRPEIALLDDAFSALDGKTEDQVFNNLFGEDGIFRKLNTTVVLVTSSDKHFSASDHVVLIGQCSVIEQGPWQSLQAMSAAMSKFIPAGGIGNRDDTPQSVDRNKLQAQVCAKEEAEVDLARKTGDFALYGYYFRFIGLSNLLLTLAGTATFAFFITVPQLWLAAWTESTGSTAFYTVGYVLMSLISWSSTSVAMWVVLIRVAPQSGMRLHQRLLDVITGAPLSYFSNTENGSILNRFSQDMQLIDKQLPVALNDAVVQSFKLIMQAALLFMAQKYLALSLPGCMVVLYIVQRVYLRTSRQLRFLELESRAAVFSNFLESIEGLETIRAFGWSRAIARENVDRVENAQRPEYLLLSLQRWLNVVLDLIAAALATVVIVLAVTLRGQVSGGQIGVALNIMLVVNSTLLKLVQSWTTLEVSLGAVSRLKMLETSVQPEDRNGMHWDPPRCWPMQGRIEFKGVTAAYHPGAVALRDINLTIDPGQRVVLFGRTGSGKSSFILTLLRMLELQPGAIQIDNIDISRVPRHTIRQRCLVTVSQDALVLSNETLRFNMDPDTLISDDIIIEALQKTRLWDHFSNRIESLSGTQSDSEAIVDMAYKDHPVLDQKVSSFPELSLGQGQLFALCRALIKVHSLRDEGVRPIILLDEVTSSLDVATEFAIHDIIDEEFTRNGHTVIVIAHRLRVLLEHARPGQDVVVRLRDGRIQDVGADLKAVVRKTAKDMLVGMD
ncbi:putative ABC transporter [Coniochaeta ligniaria NRRL 30616]|uniref:Putative ABC transporter n=1 Tax=Coniochaeta ligniaria NRRL 30616 TaxID=1408157 RepID=A0A1J7I6J5_9PEZI|nr:putative ABC transporter [Coniochaeta ligniaria NRRL 30616]